MLAEDVPKIRARGAEIRARGSEIRVLLQRRRHAGGAARALAQGARTSAAVGRRARPEQGEGLPAT